MMITVIRSIALRRKRGKINLQREGGVFGTQNNFPNKHEDKPNCHPLTLQKPKQNVAMVHTITSDLHLYFCLFSIDGMLIIDNINSQRQRIYY